MSTIRPTVLGLSFVLLCVAAAQVSAGTVQGSALEIVTFPTGKLTLSMKDIHIDSGNFGSEGDPRCDALGGGGAALRVNGGPGNDFTIVLPCEGWRSTNGSPTQVYNTDYVYKDLSGVTCSKVTVKHGRFVKAQCRGPQIAYTLGAAQGDIDVTLRLGSLPVRNCVTFGPPPTKVQRDGSNGKKYRAKHAPTPAPSCTSP